MDFNDQIAAVAAKADFGTATAAKRGRNPNWPYVPVIAHSTGGPSNTGYTQQITGKAFATREEAIAYGQRSIEAARENLARRLALPGHRLLRQHYGLPFELPSAE